VLTSRSYHRHLAQLRDQLDLIRDQVLQQFIARGFRAWYLPDAGFALWLQLPTGIGAQALASQLRLAKIVLAPGGHFSQLPDADQFMRVNITQCQHPHWWQALDQALAAGVAQTKKPASAG